MANYTDSILQSVSSSLGVDSTWLKALISFESGWNPAAQNKLSGARGLIQFTNTTAKDLGYASADDLYNKFPTADAQLQGPVLSYLSKYKPFTTKQSLYMAVFYPKARTWTLDTAFSDSIQKLNPGVKTVGDYVNKVERRLGVKTIAAGTAILLLLAFILFRKYTA